MAEKVDMRIDILTKVRDHLAERPQRVDMGVWIRDTRRSLLDDNCGTAGCLAGWTCALMDEKVLYNDYDDAALPFLLDGPAISGDREYYVAQALFHVSNWPDRYVHAILHGQSDGVALVQLLTELIDGKLWLEWDADAARVFWEERA